jgi:hypothetical protein
VVYSGPRHRTLWASSRSSSGCHGREPPQCTKHRGACPSVRHEGFRRGTPFRLGKDTLLPVLAYVCGVSGFVDVAPVGCGVGRLVLEILDALAGMRSTWLIRECCSGGHHLHVGAVVSSCSSEIGTARQCIRLSVSALLPHQGGRRCFCSAAAHGRWNQAPKEMCRKKADGIRKRASYARADQPWPLRQHKTDGCGALMLDGSRASSS